MDNKRRGQHPLAGRMVRLESTDPALRGKAYRLEDWWENVAGQSWMWCKGNPACLKYAFRAGMRGLPTDDEVVYGKIGALGELVHVSELGAEIPEEP